MNNKKYTINEMIRSETKVKLKKINDRANKKFFCQFKYKQIKETKFEKAIKNN